MSNMNKINDLSNKANILIVDDTLFNLHVLSGILKEQGYKVRPVTSGKLALKSAQSNPPDLILLDILMPEMDGYEVCQRLKADPNLKEIPVLFISALTEALDKVKAFNMGGVDFITKPFQVEEVCARVQTHLELRKSRLEIQTLLSKTFVSSIRTITDILSLANPIVFDRSNRLKRYVREIMKHLKFDHMTAWQLELAAMLSQIGCIAIPEKVLQKKQQGITLTEEEEMKFRNYPVVAAELIADIPRLETVAEIIRSLQELPDENESPTDISNVVMLGSSLLRMLIDYDYLIMSGHSSAKAMAILQSNLHSYSPILLEALKFIAEQEAKEKEIRSISVNELLNGMILLEDLVTEDGLLVLRHSNEISGNLLNLIKFFSAKHRLKEPVKVLVPTG